MRYTEQCHHSHPVGNQGQLYISVLVDTQDGMDQISHERTQNGIHNTHNVYLNVNLAVGVIEKEC